jgi:hypothetical protein
MRWTPQKLWNTYGLLILFGLACNRVLTSLRGIISSATNDTRISYITGLKLFQNFATPEAMAAVNAIQDAISRFRVELFIINLTSLLTALYWAATILRLYTRRQQGQVETMSLLWRPKFAFFTAIPIGAVYTLAIHKKVCPAYASNPIVMDYLAKISPSIHCKPFHSEGSGLIHAIGFSLGLIFASFLYFVFMKQLGKLFLRLGFQ